MTSPLRELVRTLAGGMPRPYWVLWCGLLLNRAGTFVVPFLAIYLTQARGLSIAQAGMVAAIYGAGAAVAGPVGGFIADHVGRRFTMLTALGLGGASMIGLGFAHRIEVIAPACFGVALISEMYRPGMQAAVADLVPPEDRVRAFGLTYWVINLGFAIGTTIAGLLATVSYLLLFVGDGLTTLLFALLVWRGVPETLPRHVTDSRPAPSVASFIVAYRDRVFMAFTGLSFLFSVIFMQHMLALPVDMIAHGVSKAAFGAVIALNGVVIVLLQPFLGPALAARNRSRTLAAGTALVAIGYGVNALAHTVAAYAAGVLTWTLGEICVLPASSAVVADLAPVEVRARYQGAYGLSWGLAACVAPTLGSQTLQRLGSTTLWLGALALGLLVAIGHLAMERSLATAREARLMVRVGI